RTIARRPVSPPVKEAGRLHRHCVPYWSVNLFVLDLDIDYTALIESLRRKSDLSRVPERRVTIAFTPGGKHVDVWQLAPLSAELLRLCDGKRTVGEMAREFSLPTPGVD